MNLYDGALNPYPFVKPYGEKTIYFSDKPNHSMRFATVLCQVCRVEFINFNRHFCFISRIKYPIRDICKDCKEKEK